MMDNLALSVSKSITDFLEQNEKRFIGQHTLQEQHDNTLQQVLSRLESVEKTCDNLAEENSNIKNDLETIKRREEDTNKALITIKSDLETMQKSVNDCSEWVRLITALTSQVQILIEARDSTEDAIKTIHNNQAESNRLIERQERRLNAVASTAQAAAAAATPHYRTPIRSPSTSSFFNGNMHSNSPLPPRYRQQTNHHHHYPQEDLYGQLDPNDEMSEISETAECFMKEVKVLEDLHRSFEKSSICSGD